jgi:hypothetical protein
VTIAARALPLAGVLFTACVATPTPVVRACKGVEGYTSAPSGGRLRILPSMVPGVQIDSARWSVGASTFDIGAGENLSYKTTLRSNRIVARHELALVYEAPNAPVTIDADFFAPDSSTTEIKPPSDSALLEPGVPLPVYRIVSLSSGISTGRTSVLRYCPRTVRAVPRERLAEILEPRLGDPAFRAKRLAEHGSNSPGPLKIVLDTIVEPGLGGGLMVGAAVNMSDTTLRDVVIAAIATRHLEAGTTASPRNPTIDTLEYGVASIGPHQLVVFAGEPPDAIPPLAWVAYPQSSIKGRRIAGFADRNRVTWTRSFPSPVPQSRQ